MNVARVLFCDFPGPKNIQAITELLRQVRDIEEDSDDPEYVFYSVFGYNFLRFPQAIRIFFTGENVRPDFNLCDYAFGYDWIKFEDRYCRCPNYQLYEEFRALREHRRTRSPREEAERKTGFCNFIYSNASADPYRRRLFEALCAYKKVDSAGTLLNNTGFTRGSPSLASDATEEKLAFQRTYKFTLAVENSFGVGYTTEKLIHALAADTVPIYWGNPAVGREFNEKRLINCHAYGAIEAVVDRVRELDSDPVKYREVLAQPFFPDDQVPAALQDEPVLAQLQHILCQPSELARRRGRYVWAQQYEERRLQEVRLSAAVDSLRDVRRLLRRICG